jgi:hypothetical protein
MKSKCSTTSRRCSNETESAEYSVYVGRERLGRFVCLAETKFEAFDRDDRPLGSFRKRKGALCAINAASGDRS